MDGCVGVGVGVGLDSAPVDGVEDRAGCFGDEFDIDGFWCVGRQVVVRVPEVGGIADHHGGDVGFPERGVITSSQVPDERHPAGYFERENR